MIEKEVPFSVGEGKEKIDFFCFRDKVFSK